MSIKDTIIVLLIVSFMSLFSNVLGTPTGIIDSIPGLLILAAIALAGILMAKVLPGNIPKIGFVSLCTPILAYAGVAIGKDLDAFAKNGWRIVVLACVVFTGTYIGSAIIAQAILKYLGQI